MPIARAAIQRNPFATLVQPHLDDLATRFGVIGVATQLTDPTHMVVVALSQVQLPFRLQVDMGSRIPALISATGPCFAAFNGLDEKALRERFARSHWDQPPDFETWRTEVEETRTRGYAVDRNTYISGVTVLAVPFFDGKGRMVHSMVIIGISERIDQTGIAVLAETMLSVRDEVAAIYLGGRAS